MNRRFSKPKLKSDISGWAFVLPSIVLFLWLVLWPMINAFIMSLQNGKGNMMKFAGVSNYLRLLDDPVFISSLKNTILYFVIQVPVMLVLALIVASILNNSKLKFRGIFRTAIFIPCVTSLVAYSLLFRSMFAEDGFINNVLMGLHIIDDPIPWLMDTFWAKVVIILAITWRWTGYNMIFFLSSLQNIDEDIYQAAEIDGAGAWTKFWKITVPLLKPVILLTAIMSTSGTLQLFDEVVNITNGGPNNSTMTISHYIYNLSFKYSPDFGYATAVSFVVFVLIAVLSLLQMKVSGDKND